MFIRLRRSLFLPCAALLAVAVMVVGCSAEARAPDAPATSPASADAPASADTPASGAMSAGADAPEALAVSADPGTPADPAASVGSAPSGVGEPADTPRVRASPTVPAPDVPTATTTNAAGSAARDAHRVRLEDAGMLTVDGRVTLSGPPTASSGLGATLCHYLFGSPEEVGERALLPAAPTLLPMSGIKSSANGSFVLCGYAIGPSPQLALEIGHSDDDWATGITTLITDDDIHAVLSYVPDYSGGVLPKTDTEGWLREALARVEG